MLLLALIVGCARGPSAELVEPDAPPAAREHPPKPEPPEAHWVQRTDPELEDAVRGACAASVADGRPLLVEFSAPWCLDCKTLARLEADPAVAAEYARWHRVRADVGRFDRHPLFLRAFGVDAIAHWVALRPVECGSPPPEWPRLKQGTLELATGVQGPKTAGDVVAWLEEARGRP